MEKTRSVNVFHAENPIPGIVEYNVARSAYVAKVGNRVVSVAAQLKTAVKNLIKHHATSIRCPESQLFDVKEAVRNLKHNI